MAGVTTSSMIFRICEGSSPSSGKGISISERSAPGSGRIGSAAAAFYLQLGISFIDATADVIKPKPELVPPVELYRETVVHVWTMSGRGGFVYSF